MERAEVPGTVREERLRAWIGQYSAAILKTCFVYLNDRGMAEDAAQETFFKAWKHMGDFEKKHIENEKAWLLRIAIHTCIDCRRSAWLRHTDRRKAPEDLPPQMTAEAEKDRSLTWAVQVLPEKEKRAVLLYYYQGLTLEETAEALGQSKSSVHRQLAKARESLKADLLGGDEYAG